MNSVNVSTPDHMHAPIGLRCLERGLHVYNQKPLTQTIAEARRMTSAAAAKPKLVTQMGIQIHSHEHHRTVVQLVQSGVVGAIQEVHSWSGKSWGDTTAKPEKVDAIPKSFDPVAYLLLNPDLLKNRTKPFQHYLEYGQFELGRLWEWQSL